MEDVQKKLYKEIEEKLGTKLIIYVTSERVNGP